MRVWDFSDILFNFSMDEIKQIALYGKSKFTEPNQVAVVAPQDSAYGTLRAFEVYRQEETHPMTSAFRTKPEAIEWLEGQRGILQSLRDEPRGT